MAGELKITLTRSHIGKLPAQRAVLKGMGLDRTNKTVVLRDTPEIRGMIKKVAHMVRVEE